MADITFTGGYVGSSCLKKCKNRVRSENEKDGRCYNKKCLRFSEYEAKDLLPSIKHIDNYMREYNKAKEKKND